MKQGMEELQTANVNRSIRTIKAELEYLCDVAVISPQDLSDLLSRIPPQTPIHAPISVGAIPSSLQQSQPTANASEPPSFDSLNLNGTSNNSSNRGSNNRNANGNSNANPTSFNEKVDTPYYGGPPNNTAPSPAPGVNSPYNAAPPQPVWNPTPPLANATALYAYTSADEGDLELQAGDSIAVTEYMNAEWWKGKSNRTGMEGIFPRSYVKVVEEKSMGYPGQPPTENQGMVDGQPASGHVPSKFETQGKKFGKKLGNAAIFGAGFSIGGDIVNAIL